MVRPTPVADARAAAHLARFTAEVLTAPVAHAAGVLNLAAGLRQSAARGLFRSAAAVRPGGGPPVYAPASAGTGLVGPLLPLIPDPPEALAARGFAHELGLAPADTFAAVGREFGWPCYWLGSHEFKHVEVFGVKAKSPLGRLAAARRPKRPGARHLLVVSSSIGYLVLWTPSPADGTPPGSGWDMTRVAQGIMTVSGFPLRRIRYHLAPVAVFRYLALELGVTGPRAAATPAASREAV